MARTFCPSRLQDAYHYARAGCGMESAFEGRDVTRTHNADGDTWKAASLRAAVEAGFTPPKRVTCAKLVELLADFGRLHGWSAYTSEPLAPCGDLHCTGQWCPECDAVRRPCAPGEGACAETWEAWTIPWSPLLVRRCEPFPWPHLRMLDSPRTHCADTMANDPWAPVRCRAA